MSNEAPVRYYAECYRKAGYSVIPIEWESKKPTVAWKEYQTRHATDEEFAYWFDRGDSNIAIVTGVISNLTVIDVDPRNGGIASIKGKHLGRATCLTGGGGYHYYFRHFPEANQTKPGAWKGVDLKSDGGYVLAPPSVTTGGYRFTDGEPFPPERREPLTWLVHEVAGLKDKVVEADKERVITVGNGRGSFFRITLGQVNEGGRNNHAAKLYGAMLYEGVASDRAASILRLWNANLKAPLPDGEIENVIMSITSAHMKKVRENTKEIRTQ